MSQVHVHYLVIHGYATKSNSFATKPISVLDSMNLKICYSNLNLNKLLNPIRNRSTSKDKKELK